MYHAWRSIHSKRQFVLCIYIRVQTMFAIPKSPSCPIHRWVLYPTKYSIGSIQTWTKINVALNSITGLCPNIWQPKIWQHTWHQKCSFVNHFCTLNGRAAFNNSGRWPSNAAYCLCIPGSSSSLWEQRSLLSWSIARRGVCAHITVTCRKLVLKSASCNLKRKQEVTAKQKLCIKKQRWIKKPCGLHSIQS